MQYISRLSRMEPDTMPVIKTTYYPWTDGSFRPLMYARVALLPDGLSFDLTAFEREPLTQTQDSSLVGEDSCVAVCLCPFPERSHELIAASINSRGLMKLERLGEGGEVSPLPCPEVGCYGGSDEQGWYWGVRFTLDNKLLREVYAVSELPQGHIIKGNLFKYQLAGKASHFGSVFPVSSTNFFAFDQLGEFQIV